MLCGGVHIAEAAFEQIVFVQRRASGGIVKEIDGLRRGASFVPETLALMRLPGMRQKDSGGMDATQTITGRSMAAKARPVCA